MRELKDGLFFDEENHQYIFNDKPLISVTQLIKKYIFPEMYKGVDPTLLAAKGKNGTDVHAQIEMLTNGFPFSDEYPETKQYRSWLEAHKDEHIVIDSEMPVSDNETVAGTLDQFLYDGNSYSICDIKTTSVLNIEYLRWQDSIYAYLYELNGSKKISHLYALHVTKEFCKRVEIERIDNDIIASLIKAAADGAESFENPLHKTCSDIEELVAEYAKLDAQLMDYEEVTKNIKKFQTDIKNAIIKISQDKSQVKFATSIASVTVTPKHTQSKFDKSAFIKAADEFIKTYRPEDESKQQSYDDAWKAALDGGMTTSSVAGKVTITYNK